MSIYKLSPKQGEQKPIRVLIEKSTGNEFFERGEGVNDGVPVWLAFHPSGIRCWVYKRGFKVKMVDANYNIKPLK